MKLMILLQEAVKIPMGHELVDLGVTGFIAVLVVREAFKFMRERKGLNGSGEQPIAFWQREMRSAVSEANSPLLLQQTELLREIRDLHQDIIRLLERGRRE